MVKTFKIKNLKSGVTATFNSVTKCAKYLGVSQGNVGDLLSGRQKSVKGWVLEKSRGRLAVADVMTIPVSLLTRNFIYNTVVSDFTNCTKCLRRLIMKTFYTSKAMLGPLTEIITKWNFETYDEFRARYFAEYGSQYATARQAFIDEMRKFHLSSKYYTTTFLEEFFEEGTIYSAYVGVMNQNIACQAVAEFYGMEWHLANRKEDTSGIDAWIGGKQVQVKSNSYKNFGYDANMFIEYNAQKGYIRFNNSYFEEEA